MTPEQAVATSENSHKPQNLREQFKKECEERKRKRHTLLYPVILFCHHFGAFHFA